MQDSYKHRMGAKVVRVIDGSGQPVRNAAVTVSMTKHKFLFGCAKFGVVPLANDELEGEEKRLAEFKIDKATTLFNFITLPFYWGRFEPVMGQPDTERLKKATEWLRGRGCTVKGHPLCWHTACAPWLMELSDDEILSRQLARIQRDMSDFSGIIDMWDVINEVVIMPVFDKYDNGVTRICKKLGRIELVKQVFTEAKRTNPGATLLINDFDMSKAYDTLIEELLEAGVPINAIGLQSHMHQGCWSEEKTLEILERFSRFKLPLHFTEINMVSGDLMPKHIDDLNDFVVDEWPTTPEGEIRQAADAEALYKILFAHPSVEAVTWWSFTDGGWLKAPAGFITKDGRVKPVYDRIHNLIKGDWWTPEQHLTTDGDGNIEVTGVKGDYTATYEGGILSFCL